MTSVFQDTLLTMTSVFDDALPIMICLCGGTYVGKQVVITLTFPAYKFHSDF